MVAAVRGTSLAETGVPSSKRRRTESSGTPSPRALSPRSIGATLASPKQVNLSSAFSLIEEFLPEGTDVPRVLAAVEQLSSKAANPELRAKLNQAFPQLVDNLLEKVPELRDALGDYARSFASAMPAKHREEVTSGLSKLFGLTRSSTESFALAA